MSSADPSKDLDHQLRHQQLMDRILQRYDQLDQGLAELETKLPEYDDDQQGAAKKRRRRTSKPR